MPRQTEHDNEMRGALFPNNKKQHDKSPDMTGRVTIEGKEYRLAAWTQTSRKGEKYLSLSVTDPDNYVPKDERPENTAPTLPF